MSKIIIRRPSLKDRKELNKLFRIVINDTFAREGFEDLKEQMESIIAEKTKYLEEDFSSNGAERYFLIAEIEGEVVGTIESGPSSKLLLDCTKGYENSIELGTVFVLPKFQKMGIGSMLLKAMCKKLVEENIEEVCIQSGYKIAGLVWRRLLGNPIKVIPDYWDKDYDHLIWCNKLEKSGDIRINE